MLRHSARNMVVSISEVEHEYSKLGRLVFTAIVVKYTEME